MKFLDLTLDSLAANVALDEALLLQAEAGALEILRLWEWPRYGVVLGAGGRWSEEIDDAACLADGVPVVRRSSGGGTVLLGSGCLCYSIVLSLERHPALSEIKASYCHILSLMVHALGDIAPGLHLAGTSDLACGFPPREMPVANASGSLGSFGSPCRSGSFVSRKFSGNAQQRKRRHVLHHGTLLYEFDLTRVARYLKMPLRQPEYRGQRQHGEFMMNLPIGRDGLRRRLRELWNATETVTQWPEEATAAWVEAKFGRDDWTYRR